MDPIANKSSIRFLSFANDKEDAEKEAKLREAAAKIEEAIAKQKSLAELVDHKESVEGDSTAIDPANDFRSLYERLQEQRDKKKEALEESQKLSNYVLKLDEDDVTYLNEIAKRKRDEEIRNRLRAIEERKLLEEKKLADDELKLKESLKRIPMSSSLKQTSSSSFASKLKSKLASIKVKPKLNPPTKQPGSNKLEPSDGNAESSDQSSNKRELSIASTEKSEELGSTKRQKRDDDDDPNKQINKSDDDGTRDSGHRQAKKNEDCYCKAKNVTKCIGILPSMPQVVRNPASSDDSDANSDDQLEWRLVPKVGKRRH